MNSETEKDILEQFIKHENDNLNIIKSCKENAEKKGKQIDQYIIDKYTPKMTPQQKIDVINKYFNTPLEKLNIETYKYNKDIQGTLDDKYIFKATTSTYETGLYITNGEMSISNIYELEDFYISIIPI